MEAEHERLDRLIKEAISWGRVTTALEGSAIEEYFITDQKNKYGFGGQGDVVTGKLAGPHMPGLSKEELEDYWRRRKQESPPKDFPVLEPYRSIADTIKLMKEKAQNVVIPQRQAKWGYGKINGTIVSESSDLILIGMGAMKGCDDIDIYGGFLVAESVQPDVGKMIIDEHNRENEAKQKSLQEMFDEVHNQPLQFTNSTNDKIANLISGLTEFDRLNLADAAWWLKGYRKASLQNDGSCEFVEDHEASFKKVIDALREIEILRK